MTSRKPPSQRDPEYAVQRMSRALQSMSPGTMGGRVANAGPINFKNGVSGVIAGGGGVAKYVPAPRRAVTFSTPTLGLNETYKGVVDLSPHYRVLHITTNIPARVRLYIDATERDRDYGRPITYDPFPGLGIVMDFLTDSELLSAPLSPVPEGAQFGDEPGPAVPYNVTSVNGGSVTVTLIIVALE